MTVLQTKVVQSDEHELVILIDIEKAASLGIAEGDDVLWGKVYNDGAPVVIGQKPLLLKKLTGSLEQE